MSEENEAPPAPEAEASAPAAENPRRKRSRKPGAKQFFVFDLPKGKRPAIASRTPLTLQAAKAFAESGARYGKFDRVVTTDPKKKDFRVIAKFKKGGR